MKIISIDPQPRSEINNLADQIIREPLENTGLNIFEELNDGDILFVDNSHRIFPNSDSTVFFMDILPMLRKGVIVHVHDIYLPFDYPQFMCDRFYSEQYGLAIYLLSAIGKYEIIAPNYYMSENLNVDKSLEDIWKKENLKNVEHHGGSFWFIIK